MSETCECGGPVYVKKAQLCRRCYNRTWYRANRAGDDGYLISRRVPSGVASRPRTTRATGAPTSYSAAHGRVRRQRGPASAWCCIRCGASAEQWAYRPTVAREIRGTNRDGHPRVWSPDPADYDPMCRACHAVRDGRRFRTGYRFDASRATELRRRWRNHN